MNRRRMILIGAYSALACAGGEDSRARQEATTRVMGALEAELSAAACASIASVDTLPNTFFPNVVLLRGSCAAEHRGTVTRVAGIDSDGVVYTLDSPSAFRWLLARHTPRNLDSTHMVAYAHLALALTGQVDAQAPLIQDVDDLPSHVRSGLAPGAAEDLPKGVIEIEENAADVWVVTYDGTRVIAHEVAVFLPAGVVVAMPHIMWTASRRP